MSLPADVMDELELQFQLLMMGENIARNM